MHYSGDDGNSGSNGEDDVNDRDGGDSEAMRYKLCMIWASNLI